MAGSMTSLPDSRLDCPTSSLDVFNWREKRQRLFMYWCLTHFIHGMIHSIRYSSQYLYFKDVMQVSNPDFLYGLSVSFIGATGVIFPLAISPFIDQTRNIKQVILLVNALGFLGNLLYALPFSPVLPLLGQLLAGTTPAFGVIAIGEVSRSYAPENLTKRISALSLVYSIGTFTSIGLVFCFLYVDFWIGKWHITFANMPGLTLMLFFMASTILSFFLVSDISKEFDLKLEERIKRSSCASTPHHSRLPSTAPTPEGSRKSSPQNVQYLSPSKLHEASKRFPGYLQRKQCALSIPEIVEPEEKIIKDVGDPYYFDRISPVESANQYNFPRFSPRKMCHSDSTNSEESLNSTARKTLKSIVKILRYRPALLLMMVTFTEAFVYSIIVTCLPVLAANFLKWGKVELAFLSMVNKFLSVIISGSVYFLTDYLNDFLLLAYGTFLSLLALLALSVLNMVIGNPNATIGLLFVVACLAIAAVPLIITSTRSMLAKLVPTEIQSLTEAVRMSVFEASFVPGGFLVPVVTMSVPTTAVCLMVLTSSVVAYTIHQRELLIDIKEQDEYWLNDNE